MTAPDLGELETALAKAATAALRVPSASRLQFVASHLLAQADGTTLPVAEDAVPGALMDALMLQELAKQVTMSVNRACNKPGWPLRAVALELGASSTVEPPAVQGAEGEPAAGTAAIVQRALREAAQARLALNQPAINAAVAKLSEATTGAAKKAAAAERARLEEKSAEELSAETEAAIQEALSRGASTDKYDDPEAIFKALEDGSTQLVRGTWVRDAPPGAVLKKRGEMPEEALIGVAELRDIYQKSKGHSLKHRSLPFIALSHYWRTKTHPDPEGETLAQLSKALKRQWHEYQSKGVTDVGVFIDWSSLYQEPRSQEQLAIFKTSLGAINLWYAHKLTSVYIVSGGEVDGLTYADKGWTSFEYLLANLVKIANTSAQKDWPMLLDLGYDDPVMGAARPPPAEPLAFCAGHAFGAKVYTNGADRDAIVAPKFQKTIEEVLGSVEELNYNVLGWGDEQVVQLAAVLPLCTRLQKLELVRNAIGDVGAKTLAKAAASGALAQCTLLNLAGNQIGDVGLTALASACASGAQAQCQGLGLAGNQIGDAGITAFADACASGALAHLQVSSHLTVLLRCPDAWHAHSPDSDVSFDVPFVPFTVAWPT